jgi:hypothetical protein
MFAWQRKVTQRLNSASRSADDGANATPLHVTPNFGK